MASPSTQVALIAVGLLGLAVVGAHVLPAPQGDVERHQVPTQIPTAPSLPGNGNPLNVDQLEVRLSPTGGASSVKVWSPTAPRQVLVEMRAGATGTTVNALNAQPPVFTSGSAAPILVEGDVLRDEVVTFRLPATTAANLWVKVDRSVQPLRITLAPGFFAAAQGAPQALPPVEHIWAPVAWRGDALDPSEVALFVPSAEDPLDSNQLMFRYKDHGDGTSSVAHRDPASQQLKEAARVQHALVAMRGSPAEAQWSVRISPQGAAPTTFTVPLDALRQHLSATGQDPTSYLRVARDAAIDVQAYKAATDGTRTLAPAELAGERFLAVGAHAIHVDVPERQVLGAPIVQLEASQGPAPIELKAERGAAANGHVRHTAPVSTAAAAWLAAVPDGSTITFRIAHRTTVAKLVTEQLLDDNNGQGYRYRLDKAPPAMGSVTTTVTDPAEPHKLQVSWSARDGASGVASYKVEKRRDGGPWEPWIASTATTSALFTGAPGKSYAFRVGATDMVGNTVPEAMAAVSPTHAVPAAQGPENRPPSIQLLQPTGGETFAGVPSVVVKWRASDPDGTQPVINLYVSDDAGATWQALASPTGTQWTWDVSALAPGDYRLKAEATDGSLASQDTSQRFRVDTSSLGTASTIGGPNAKGLPGSEGSPEGGPEAQAQGAAGGPVDPMLLVGVAVLLIGCAGGVAVWRWKQQRN